MSYNSLKSISWVTLWLSIILTYFLVLLQVLKSVLQLLPNPALKKVTIHFEKAIFFQVQELGLQADYNKDWGTYAYIRTAITLLFLPATEIPAMYGQFQGMVNAVRWQELDQRLHMQAILLEDLKGPSFLSTC